MAFYLVEKSYFEVGNRTKIVLKLYMVRKSKGKCTDRRSKIRPCQERIAKIDLNKLKWESGQ